MFTITSAVPVLELARSKRLVPKYNTTSKLVRGAINVHIQPHSHMDLGWLKTFDSYLSGFNNTIQVAGVGWTYQSVAQALTRNPDRRFITVEMGFLMRWLDTQPADVVASVKALVAADQLQLISAGWCMHDEATATYNDMIDQMTLGHRLASATFGPAATARVAWQIDPFGHSSAQGSHMSAGMGLSSMFYGRLDYQEQAWRIANNATEYVWRPSRSLGKSAQIFAGFNVHGYDPPQPQGGGNIFEWDITSDQVTKPPLLFGPLQPHPDIDHYNVNEYVAMTIELAQTQSKYILPDSDGTVHIAWQFGTDFNYQAAEHWFTQIDGLINFVNQNQSAVNLLYSTPREYADAKMGQNTEWPLKDAALPDGLSTDQFPYITNAHWQWSGYFSSRPGLKGYVRTASSLFQVARQLQSFTGGAPADSLGPSNPLFALERALATAQHHDAVTGTARQHVTYDYAALLSKGIADAELLFSAALAQLTGYTTNYVLCPLSNATICAPLESTRAGDPPTIVILYNADSKPRLSAPVRLPIALNSGVTSFRVVDSTGNADVTAQLLPASTIDISLRESYYGVSAAPMSWLAWQAQNVPPFGFAVFFLSPVASNTEAPFTHQSIVRHMVMDASASDETVSNGIVTLTLDSVTGLVSSFSDTHSGISTPLSQFAGFYRASPGCLLPPNTCDIPNDGTGLSAFGQSSTTYILRPNSSQLYNLGNAVVDLVSGPVVNEARQVWGGDGWASSVLRLWSNSNIIETEYTIGPIPLEDNWGKEIVIAWEMNGGWSQGQVPTLYTDSNGLEKQKRVLNARSFPSNASAYEPVASNYYPVTTRASLLDEATNRRFTLAVDRATGCASLSTGNIECILHRRHLNTTFLGMGEILNETGLDLSGRGLITRVTHMLRFDTNVTSAESGATATIASLLPLANFFASSNVTPPQWVNSYTSLFAGLRSPLPPPQLHILTAQSLGGDQLLLRVQHLYEVDEDPALSLNATVALGPLFSAFNITAVTEMTLSASLPLDQVKKWTLRVQGESEAITLPIVPAPPQGPLFLVELAPQQIRTFIATILS